MLWVVIGHAFIGELIKQSEWPVWERTLMGIAYSFHMPLFMFVSGWLFYLTRLKDNITNTNLGRAKWTYKSILYDKAKRLLLPGLVFSILALIVKIAFPGEVTRQIGLSFKELINAFLYPYDNPFRELWFIAALFWLFALTPIWRYVIRQQWSIWLTLAILFIMHFYHPNTKLLSIDRVCEHALWFYLGIIISKESLVDRFLKHNFFLYLIIGFVIYLLGVFLDYSILKTLGGILFSIAISLLLDRYLPSSFSSFRNYTYQIFLIGIFAQMFVKIMHRRFELQYLGSYILCIILGLYVPVLVSKLVEKINWEPLSLCVGLKTK